MAFKFPSMIHILDLFYPSDVIDWQVLEFDTLYELASAHFVEVDPCFVIQEYKNPKVFIFIFMFYKIIFR